MFQHKKSRAVLPWLMLVRDSSSKALKQGSFLQALCIINTQWPQCVIYGICVFIYNECSRGDWLWQLVAKAYRWTRTHLLHHILQCVTKSQFTILPEAKCWLVAFLLPATVHEVQLFILCSCVFTVTLIPERNHLLEKSYLCFSTDMHGLVTGLQTVSSVKRGLGSGTRQLLISWLHNSESQLPFKLRIRSPLKKQEAAFLQTPLKLPFCHDRLMSKDECFKKRINILSQLSV